VSYLTSVIQYGKPQPKRIIIAALAPTPHNKIGRRPNRSANYGVVHIVRMNTTFWKADMNGIRE
jgi:hypothetical protein